MPHASVLTRFGPPSVLAWSAVDMPEPAAGQIRMRVRAAGVSPTDIKIRRGDLGAAFALPPSAVLGFEAAGVVDAIGPGVTGPAVGDEIAALLPTLGGYSEYVITSTWTPKPANVSWAVAAALPASAEAAVGVLRQLNVISGETLLILGGGGSVGIIAAQLARTQGLTVIGAAGKRDHDVLRELGAIPVLPGAALADTVRAQVSRVDAVLDAAGKGGLSDAIELAGGPSRVITLADEHAAQLGVRLSAPTPDRAPDAVDRTMPLLASGALRLRAQRLVPLQQAAEAHALVESGDIHEKVVLTVD